ncbi:MAG: peptidylprolyl isomerase [Chloracidobacterium sp.]|nr:peptidylprolyl isomerase [Chloracidobacterium sp.]
MSNLTKGLILVVVILAIGAGLVVWKKKVGGQSSESFNQITRPEIEALLADVAKTNPMVLKRLKEDPEMKKDQVKNLKQLLAFASEAQREGLTADPTNRQELENIRAEILAVNYDKEINKDKGPMPPFGFITEDQINAFWAGETPAGTGQGWFAGMMEKIGLGAPTEQRSHDAEFADFLDTKIKVLKASSPEMKDREISDEERTQARDIFAKTRIYRAEYLQKVNAGELAPEFVTKANLQVKLQQAQYLARLYSEKRADTDKVTDEDVAKYITEHPELSPDTKRAQAQQILERAKAGEDFAALANEFTQDPGNKGPDGTMQGGIYKDVPKGRMVVPFETAALALEEGAVSPELVETDYGFHIIKLERKLGPSPNKPASKDTKAPEDTYDARHILISTGFKDPEKPNAREMPVKDYVRSKLEEEKEKKLVEDLIAKNNIQVPDDFTVPEVTEEQMQQMREKQQPQMPPGGIPPGVQVTGPDGKPVKPDAKKPEPKKK